MDEFQKIKSEIKLGLSVSIEKAIGLFDKYISPNSINFNDIIIQKNRYRGVNDHFHKGIISREIFDLEVGKIRFALLNMVDLLESEDFQNTILTSFPLSEEQVLERHEKKAIVNKGLRLIPKKDFQFDGKLGKVEREYVFIGDYEEQKGRTLREIISNLWIGDAFDKEFSSVGDWLGIIIEIGDLNFRKLDLLPGTWKSFYRIFSDKKRLNIFESNEDCKIAMGIPPRDYYSDDQKFWHNQLEKAFIESELKYNTLQNFLEQKIGFSWLCFSGKGITHKKTHFVNQSMIPSRIFIIKNQNFNDVNYKFQDLGTVNENRILE